MEIKQKSKVTNILKITVFTLILLILMLGVSTKTNAAELFWEDVPLSFHGVPRYGDIGPLVFCSKKGYGTEVYIDCSTKIANLLGSGTSIEHYWGFGGTRYSKTYTVLNEDPKTKTNYDWSGGPYPIAERYGPIWNSDVFRSDVSNFISDLIKAGNAHGSNLLGFTVGGVDYTNPSNYYRVYGSGAGFDYDGVKFSFDRIINKEIGLPMFAGSGTRKTSFIFNAI